VKAMTVEHQVGGDGMVRKAMRVNQGDLQTKRDGVHGPWSRRAVGAGVRVLI